MASPVTHLRAAALALVALASCASAPPRPSPSPRVAPPAPPTPAGGVLALGLGARELRAAWGEPTSIQDIPSPAAPGLVYERWRWGEPGVGREALLIDGRVVDFLDPKPARPAGAPEERGAGSGSSEPASGKDPAAR